MASLHPKAVYLFWWSAFWTLFFILLLVTFFVSFFFIENVIIGRLNFVVMYLIAIIFVSLVAAMLWARQQASASASQDTVLCVFQRASYPA